MANEIRDLEVVQNLVHVIRGRRVILDADLAKLYGVTTGSLNQQIARNPEKFPDDFAFVLTRQELTNLISQNVISSSAHGGTRKLPRAFTEHGAIMAATVLKSAQAIEMSVFVVRAFVRMREMLTEYKELAVRLEAVERNLHSHDDAIRGLAQAVRQLMTPPAHDHKQIGFVRRESKKTNEK